VTRRSLTKLDADLASLAVQVGVLRRWWTIDQVDFPALTITFAVPYDRFEPARLTLRLDCTGYPEQAPTGAPIDPETGGLLDQSHRPTHGRCAMTFRTDWENGRALYLPVDRVALNGHPDWPTVHAHEIWDPELGIGQLLVMVRRDLTEGEDACLALAA
jgi:hypothetical protein